MKVTFVKAGSRRYSVHVERQRSPDLWCGSIGYDDWLPHDLLHFVAEAEYGLDGGVFGDLAAGGNARVFQPVDKTLVAKMWRRQRIRPTRLRDGRRSEELAAKWHALEVGESLTLEWPRPERRRRHPAPSRRRPATARRR